MTNKIPEQIPSSLGFSCNKQTFERLAVIIDHLGVNNRSAAINYAIKIASDAITRDA